MSSDPVSHQVALPYDEQPRVTRTAVVPGPSASAIALATFTIVLGLLLGIATKGAGDTSMSLRLPSLLAALLMVGQGIVSFRQGLVAKPTVERVPEDEPVILSRELPQGPPSRARTQSVTVFASPKPPASTFAIPLAVAVLGIWLGYTDLVTDAPDSLSVLALISAFALFALGWGMLPSSKS